MTFSFDIKTNMLDDFIGNPIARPIGIALKDRDIMGGSGPSGVFFEIGVVGVRRLVAPLPFGGPGCVLHVDTTALYAIATGGPGIVPLPIPRLPEGNCVDLVAQVVALDATSGLLVLSNALDLRFGQAR